MTEWSRLAGRVGKPTRSRFAGALFKAFRSLPQEPVMALKAASQAARGASLGGLQTSFDSAPDC